MDLIQRQRVRQRAGLDGDDQPPPRSWVRTIRFLVHFFLQDVLCMAGQGICHISCTLHIYDGVTVFNVEELGIGWMAVPLV